jgi:triosephosphate isomerase (TIM)
MRQRIVAGNWKMNCDREEAFALATEIRDIIKDEKTNDSKVILFPSFVHLSALTHLLSGTGIETGAQNCSSEISGAFTGEVSASMIKSVGATHIIVGHSERRHYFLESNETLLKKLNICFSQKLTPVFCIGETLTEREGNTQLQVIKKQLEETVFMLDSELACNLIIAYEPVWAIGTGKTATADEAQEMHVYIRNLLSDKYGNAISSQIPLLYGGSCNEKNAHELFSLADVDGGLIGGASLKSRSFVNIVNSF